MAGERNRNSIERWSAPIARKPHSALDTPATAAPSGPLFTQYNIQTHGRGTTMAQYDCLKCPGYCCSYPVIGVTVRDVERLARHFDITPDAARKRFTRKAHGLELVLRRKNDPHFGRTCGFFDTVERRCTVYAARPGVCRRFPGEARCGYYDFLKFERSHQEDEDYVAVTDSGMFR